VSTQLPCHNASKTPRISSLTASKCNSASCHGSGSSNGDFTAYAGIKPLADNGRLETRVLDLQDMPRNGSLTSEQLGQFKCWLDDGAPDN